MTEHDLDRRLSAWLAGRDPGEPPAALRASAARVPFEVPPPLGARFADALASRWAIPHRQTYRALRVALALILLLVALIVALAIAGSLPPNPNDLVRLSQATHRDPPPFTMTIRLPADFGCATGPSDPRSSISWRYTYDGTGAVRRDCLIDGIIDGYDVENDSVAGSWDGTAWVVEPADEVSQARPLFTVDTLNWVQFSSLDPSPSGTEGTLVECPEWVLGGVENVAGRPARIVSCDNARYWIDEASHLLVRIEEDGQLLSEALVLEVNTAPPADLFAIESRPNVRWALRKGEVPAAWSQSQVGGGVFDTASLLGRPAAVLFAERPCTGPCLSLEDFAAVTGSRSDRLAAAAISSGPITSAERAAAGAAGLPLIDDDSRGTSGWAITQQDANIALFDATGRVVAFIDPRTSVSLEAAVDAFLADEAIPETPVGDGVFVRGHRPPPLTAALLEDAAAEFVLTTGQPVVVLSPAWESAGDAEARHAAQELVLMFSEAQRLVGGRATFVVIAWGQGYGGSPPPEWTDVLREVRDAVGGSAEDLIVIRGDTYGMNGWSMNGWTSLGWIGGLENVWDPAIVLIDSDGRVVDVRWGASMPDASELAEIIRTMERTHP